MKKIMLLLLLAVSSVALLGCNSSEYKVDGKFMAYDLHTHSDGTPMITMVTVTVKDGKVTAFYIDALQSKKVTEGEAVSHVWNAKTKKELGDDYGMVQFGDAIAEWDDQAALIEAFMLANGTEAVTTEKDGYIDNITGVTMKDGGYTTVAAAALELAKEGKFQAITWGTSYGKPQVVMASMVVNKKGEVSELFLDTLQSDLTADSKFAWNAKTKQELGFDYGMKGFQGCTLEWFEQAALITDYIAENGWTMNATPEVAGVTITTGDYFKTFDKLFTFAGSSVK